MFASVVPRKETATRHHISACLIPLWNFDLSGFFPGLVFNPIPTLTLFCTGRNQPISEYHVTTAGRNRVKVQETRDNFIVIQ